MSDQPCIPGPSGNGKHANGSIVAYLSELLQLSPAQLIATSVLLQKRLGAATTSGSDEYRVPADRDFVCFQIQTTWKPTLLATEPVVNAVMRAQSFRDLEMTRLANCLVGVQNKDRNLKFFDARDMPMNSMHETPLYFPAMAPLLVPATHTIKADFTLQDLTASVVGNDSDYGIALVGVLIPKRI